MLHLTLLVLAQTPAAAPENLETYLTPPKPIAEAAQAPYYKNVTPGAISPDGTRFLILPRDGMPPLAALAKHHYNLGGLQIDDEANRNRTMTTRSGSGLSIFEIATKKQVNVSVPKDRRVSDAKWSPDGKWVAFLVHAENWTKLYVADPNSGKSKEATGRPLLATLDADYEWTRDDHLVAVFLPDHRPTCPSTPDVATTPHLQISDQKGARLQTYPSVLKTPHDEALLEYYTTGELGLVDPGRGSLAEIGKPAMYRTVTPSAHGKFFIVSVMQKPFSYLVPTASFGERQTVIDASGKELVELDKRPLRTGAPNEAPARANGRRQVEWMPGTDDLVYVQSVAAATDDTGDDTAPDTPAGPRHDRISVWKAPFTAKDATALYDAAGALTNFAFASDGKGMFITEGAGGGFGGRRGGGGGGGGGARAQAPQRGAAAPAELPRRLSFISGPGAKAVTFATIAPNGAESPNLVRGADGLTLLSPDGKTAYLSGEHVYPDPYKEAPKPFIDSVTIADGKRTRIFESSADKFEMPTLLDAGGSQLLVNRQSPTQVPQSFLVNTASKAETQPTENRDYLPEVSQARREYFTVTRADGFKFRVKVTLPNYAHNAPCFFWIYPAEFADQAAYDRSKRNFNKNLFTAPSGANKDILIRLGYVVAEPDVPITGPTGRMNDEYVPCLRNSLSAAIDELEARGWIDRKRLACGGHSYGAFSTANALAHTPFFKCGIAGDGNYLRPLTPFGFQNEGRQLWEARGTYLDMSPLLYAEQFTGALLMYHGQEDQNVGTDPINSDRLFNALEQLGKPAELVTYPYEDHGQIARESILDQWARFTAWLEKW